MNSSQMMREALIQCGELDDMALIDAGDGRILPFPLEKAYAVFSDGVMSSGFLIGADNMLCAETIEVRIYVPESATIQQCREYSKRLCIAAAEADTGSSINSISVSECSFNENCSAWEEKITFSMAQSAETVQREE